MSSRTGEGQHGRWTAIRELRRLGFEPDVVRTTGPGHATAAARDAMRAGTGLVVAAGGDGTVREVANGLLGDCHGAGPVLGVLPMGSGSDFVRSFGIPRTPVRAARRLADGELLGATPATFEVLPGALRLRA